MNGWALGGGTEVLLCTDIRIVARSAKLGLPEINLELFGGAGGSQPLMQQVSRCKARKLMFLGDQIAADEAERIGLFNRMVDDADVLDAALAEQIGIKSPIVLKLLKRTLRDGAGMPPSAVLRREQAMIGLVLDSRDAHDAYRAFPDKRATALEGA